MSIDYDNIKRLVSLMEKNRLSELTVEEGDLTITIKAEPTVTAAVPVGQQAVHVEVPAGIPIHAVQAEAPIAGPEEVAHENYYEIKSPMVGVFYRCPSPDSPSYVEVGDEVEVGQTIGLIEAMKVFSEVPSEVAGRVVEIPVESGTLVQHEDVLLVVDTSSAGEPHNFG